MREPLNIALGLLILLGAPACGRSGAKVIGECYEDVRQLLSSTSFETDETNPGVPAGDGYVAPSTNARTGERVADLPGLSKVMTVQNAWPITIPGNRVGVSFWLFCVGIAPDATAKMLASTDGGLSFSPSSSADVSLANRPYAVWVQSEAFFEFDSSELPLTYQLVVERGSELVAGPIYVLVDDIEVYGMNVPASCN
jgi:hypothetical protein